MTQHIISNSRQAQFEEMQRMLDKGAFVLTGFVETDEGLRPVSFTFGVDFMVADIVNTFAPYMALHIMNMIQTAKNTDVTEYNAPKSDAVH
jgi:hypothetical protein